MKIRVLVSEDYENYVKNIRLLAHGQLYDSLCHICTCVCVCVYMLFSFVFFHIFSLGIVWVCSKESNLKGFGVTFPILLRTTLGWFSIFK